jgi:hypothetical protein
MNVYLFTCRHCGQLNGCADRPNKDCFVDLESGSLIICDRCLRKSPYRNSEIEEWKPFG